MKALIIGYGSSGQRHARILQKLDYDVCVISRQCGTIDNSFPAVGSGKSVSVECISLEHALEQTTPDYVVIANETSLHYQTLRQIRELGYRGTVLVEKPLFGTVQHTHELDLKNTFAGYNLRFHPMLLHLKKLLQEDQILSAHVYVGQYLPTWRTGDYRYSYSATKGRGGGVLRDLSHELDYIQWLFGSWERVSAAGGHFSTLQIDSDDVFALLLSTANCPIASIQLNYLDRLRQRQIIVNTDAVTYTADFIKNTLTSDNETVHFRIKLDDTYKWQHVAAAKQDDTVLCTAKDALQTDELIVSAENAALEGRWVHK